MQFLIIYLLNKFLFILIIMSTTFIDITSSSYSNLNQFTVVTTSSILLGPSAPNTTTIGPNAYGSVIAPAGNFSGIQITPTTQTNTELGALITAIQSNPTTSSIFGSFSDVTYTPGTYVSIDTSGINYDGTEAPFTITLDANDDPSGQFFFISTGNILFTNVTNIILQHGASTNNIFWLAADSITFSGTPTQIPGIFISGQGGSPLLSSMSLPNNSNIYGYLYAKTGPITFQGGDSVVDSTNTILCYAKGTLILTKTGLVPIENIKVGDNIITKGKIHNNADFVQSADVKIEPVTWISNFKVGLLDSTSRPICIKKNAFGENTPFQDLYVSPGHRLLLNNKMVLVSSIVNGTTIYQDNDCNVAEYYHLECEYHSAIFANGVLAETYLEMNNLKNKFDKAQ
jgi:hypothetical protein